MTTSGDVLISITDNGAAAILVPASSVQLVIGCCSGGTVNQIVSTRSPTSLFNTCGIGPGVEAAALAINAGATVLFIKTPPTTKGTATAVTYTGTGTSKVGFILDSTNGCFDSYFFRMNVLTGWTVGTAGGIVQVSLDAGRTYGPGIPIGTATSLAIPNTGMTVAFGATSAAQTAVYTALNNLRTAAIAHFVIVSGSPAVHIAADTTDSAALTAIPVASTPASAVTLYNALVATLGIHMGSVTYHTVGDSVAEAALGAILQTAITTSDVVANLSALTALYNAHRVLVGSGPVHGSADSTNTCAAYTTPAAATLVAADYATASTTEPLWGVSDVQAALAAYQASGYALVGVGSVHLVGNVLTGSQATTLGGTLETEAAAYLYDAMICSTRDAAKPTAWGGAGETEATWMAAIIADYMACAQKRMSVSAGFYNMASAYPNAVAGTPLYRRPLSFAYAAREVAIAFQTHAGRVKDGQLSQINVNPTTDPTDGFIYHDERLNPGLDILTGGAGRFTSARTRIGKGQGYYIVNPLLMAAPGSQFTMWPYIAVMNVACEIVHQVGQNDINEDLRTNPNGTLYPNDIASIQANMLGAINQQMTSQAMISSATVFVDPAQNVAATSNVNVQITIFARTYILQETVTIGFGSSTAAN